MKQLSFVLLISCLSFAVILSSCGKKCDPSKNVKIGEQYFTVKYLSPTGINYLTDTAGWDLNNVAVNFDKSGGKNPEFQPMIPGHAQGVFGPFNYIKQGGFLDSISQEPVIERLLAKTIKFNYHIKKDTLGEDVFQVEFQLNASECNYYWKVLNIYRKKAGATKFEIIPDVTGKEKAEITIVE